MAKILVVDDEMGIRELLSEILDDEGHEVLLAHNAAAARPIYANEAIELVLLDIWMPDTDGMSLLREWTAAAPLRCPVIMMSGHANIDTAVEAQNLGAVGFLEKPITLQKLLSDVHKALHRSALLPTPTEHAEPEPALSKPASTAVQSPALSEWHAALSRTTLDVSLKAFREQAERIYFLYIIEREQSAMTKVAEQVGLERTHLYRKLKQLNIEVNRKTKA